jgi:hypothetical protein
MKSIIVTGDVVRDCHFYEGERANADSSKPRGFRPQAGVPGGALLLCNLIRKVLEPNPECRVEFGLDIDLNKLPDQYHAYSFWRPQAADPKEQDPAKKTVVWRAVEPPLGYGQPDESADTAASFGRRRDIRNPDILVIDDAGRRLSGMGCPEAERLRRRRRSLGGNQPTLSGQSDRHHLGRSAPPERQPHRPRAVVGSDGRGSQSRAGREPPPEAAQPGPASHRYFSIGRGLLAGKPAEGGARTGASRDARLRRRRRGRGMGRFTGGRDRLRLSIVLHRCRLCRPS